MSSIIPMGSYRAEDAQREQYLRGIAAGSQQQSGFGAMNAYNGQAMAAQQYNQTILQGLGKQMNPRAKYMIDGKPMELGEFIDTLFPDDCPERTYLLLKLTKGEKDE